MFTHRLCKRPVIGAVVEDSSLAQGSSTVCEHATSSIVIIDVACSHTVERPGTQLLSSNTAPLPGLAPIEMLA